MPSELLADVALRAAIPGADAVFTYRVPKRLHALARPGQLVWAPLRRQRVQGIILDLFRQNERGEWLLEGDQSSAERPSIEWLRPDPEAPSAPDAPVLRDLVDVADPEAALVPGQVRLARWLSEYYRVSLYEALALMLPPGVAQEAEPTWRATPAGLSAELGALPERERAVLYFLRQRGELTERDLRRALRGGDSDLREIYGALQERGMVTRGAAISSPRARPRTERMARLLVPPAALDAALDGLGRAPKQRAVLEFLRTHGYGAGVEAETAESATRKQGDRETGGASHGLVSHGLPISQSPSLLVSQPSEALPYPASALQEAAGADLATLRALEARGLLELTAREVRRDPLAGDAVPPDIPPQLTPAQERAWQPIADALERSYELRVKSEELDGQPLFNAISQLSTLNSQLSTLLLHGITGSGKTELYLRAIARALRRGRQTLVLVPEIALTAQLVRRFAARFPGRLAVLHSGLSLGERYDEWRRLRRGEAMLAIGSRSAVFAPLPNLGLIIVDEEHEPSYKHDAAPRYHARDVAMRLAAISGSVLILGSATPSVESYSAARGGQIALVELSERVGMATDARGLPRSITLPLPPVKIVDMRHELQHGNRSIFSRPLQSALAGALERGEQAILFLNRRGAASFIMCRDCGHVVACPNCATPLVLHFDEGAGNGSWEIGVRGSPAPNSQPPTPNILVCHSCNHRELPPAQCPECWSPRVKSFGAGTQRVVAEVEQMFPQARTLRWDRDSVTRKGDHARMLDRFLRHEADVLVGTQMIAKGLDLPLVSVVGVVAADTGLHLPDFRAGERTFQLLTQVAGRAGRRSAGAQVVLQTYAPDHYALQAAQEHDYRAFYDQEIAFRRQIGYPPFSRLVRFVHTSASDQRGQRAALELAGAIERLAGEIDMGAWSMIGPAPAFFHRQRNRFRWHLIVRAANPAPLLEALELPHGWALDVDPVHVL